MAGLFQIKITTTGSDQSLPQMDSDGSALVQGSMGLVVLLALHLCVHGQISFAQPVRAGNVSQAGGRQDQKRLSVRKGPDDADPGMDLAHRALAWAGRFESGASTPLAMNSRRGSCLVALGEAASISSAA